MGCAEETPAAHSEASLPGVPGLLLWAAGSRRDEVLKVTAQHERLLPACVQEEPKPIQGPPGRN